MSRRTAVLVGAAATVSLAMVGVIVELLRSNFVRDQVTANYLTLPFSMTVAALWVGVAVAVRRPRVPTGWLLTAGAAGTGLGFWRFSTHPWLATSGLVVYFATALLPLHAALGQGRGVGRTVDALLRATTVVLAGLAALIALTAPPGVLSRWFVAADPIRHADNTFQRFDAEPVARGAYVTWWVVLLAAAVVGLIARVRRWRAAARGPRREEAPVVIGALLWTAAMFGAAALAPVDRIPLARQALADHSAIALPALALGVLAGAIGWVELVAPRLTRRPGAVELRSLEPDRTGLQALLADLLATPRVDVAYAIDGGWIDTHGRALDLASDARVATVVRVDGVPLAAVLHERDVPRDAVQLGARLAVAQLVAERATALARARAEHVRAATAELVRAGDRAARAIARDLQAGPVPALDALARRLRAEPETTAVAAESLRGITADVRELSHGLLPRELEAGGLAVLGPRATVERRLPSAIEITVYLLAADDSHAEVRDDGDAIVVTRATAPGAEAIARASALGGRIDGTVATVPVL